MIVSNFAAGVRIPKFTSTLAFIKHRALIEQLWRILKQRISQFEKSSKKWPRGNVSNLETNLIHFFSDIMVTMYIYIYNTRQIWYDDLLRASRVSMMNDDPCFTAGRGWTSIHPTVGACFIAFVPFKDGRSTPPPCKDRSVGTVFAVGPGNSSGSIWSFHQKHFWLVVEPTHLKNIGQNGNLPQKSVNIKNVWNHHLDFLGVVYIFPEPVSLPLRILRNPNQHSEGIYETEKFSSHPERETNQNTSPMLTFLVAGYSMAIHP